jgi:two-component system response regulator (stage 0 sporulation protein F)
MQLWPKANEAVYLSGRTGMKRILVVDDEDNIRDYLREELADEGYEVLTATSAPEALKIIEKEDLHLVVLDIRMPGMTGVEALPRILGLKENLPVILNTAYSQYQQDFMAWAANAYIIKSFDLTELKEKIKELLK